MPVTSPPRHRPRIPLLLLALLLLGAAAAQGLGGWPHFRAELLDAGVAPGTVAAVAAGWLFGSALLLCLAGLCFAAAASRDGRIGAPVLATAVAILFTGFGGLAWWLRGNAHYAHFVLLGVLAALLAWSAARRPR